MYFFNLEIFSLIFDGNAEDNFVFRLNKSSTVNSSSLDIGSTKVNG